MRKGRESRRKEKEKELARDFLHDHRVGGTCFKIDNVVAHMLGGDGASWLFVALKPSWQYDLVSSDGYLAHRLGSILGMQPLGGLC